MEFEEIWKSIEENIPKSMTMNEYKNYILGFVFYRYLSLHQESYLSDNNVIDVELYDSVNEAYCICAVDEFLDDYLKDISSSLGYAIKPYDTWESIVKRIMENTLIPEDYQNVFSNFDKSTELNHDMGKNFRGIFEDVKIGDVRLGNDTKARTLTLTKIVRTVDAMNFDDPALLFRNLIEQFANNSGKTGGKFYTPQAVSGLMAQIVTTGTKDSDGMYSVYDSSCGSGSTLLELQKAFPAGSHQRTIKYYGQEIELTTYNLAKMNLFINGVSANNFVLRNSDTLGADWPDGMDEKGTEHVRVFDAVVSDIEFSRKWDNSASRLKESRFKNYGALAPKAKADYAFVLHGLYHLDRMGTMAVVVPHGVLFRGKTEEEIRKNLIDNPNGNQIYAVIGLPENIMFSEKGKKSVAVVILVLKKSRDTSDTLFIDASQDFKKQKNKNVLLKEHIEKILCAYRERKNIDKYAYLASLDEIKENGFNLNIPRYIDRHEEEEIPNPLDICKMLEDDEREIEPVKAEVMRTLKLLGIGKSD